MPRRITIEDYDELVKENEELKILISTKVRDFNKKLKDFSSEVSFGQLKEDVANLKIHVDDAISDIRELKITSSIVPESIEETLRRIYTSGQMYSLPSNPALTTLFSQLIRKELETSNPVIEDYVQKIIWKTLGGIVASVPAAQTYLDTESASFQSIIDQAAKKLNTDTPF